MEREMINVNANLIKESVSTSDARIKTVPVKCKN